MFSLLFFSLHSAFVLFFAFVSFVINCLVSFLSSFICQVVLLFFVFFVFVSFLVCVCLLVLVWCFFLI